MALKRGLLGVNRIRGGGGGGGGGGSRSAFILLVFFCVFAPLVFFVGRGVYIDSSNDYSNDSLEQDLDWRERLAMQSLRSLFSKEASVLDVITASTADLGPFSLDSFKKNNLSASYREAVVDTSVRNSQNQTTSSAMNAKRDITSKGGSHQKVETPAKFYRRQLREKRREMRANELVQRNDDTILKLENAAIERSKSVDSAVLGKYSIWRRENENDNSDSNIRLMRDQVIMARVYSGIAKLKNKTELLQELQARIKDSQRVLAEATTDADLPRRSLKKQSTFLAQLAAKTIPNPIHCLSMRLTIDYYLLSPEKRKFPRRENRENPNLYHYALFSDNVLAASVVVNSTIMNAKDPSKHVFHLVTDKLNFAAMNMWFLLNPPGKATIHVENVDEFKWLNSSYCPVLRQLESAAMKEYYFKADHPSSGSSNLKYRNPKYLSMLNHLRFYLPEVYPKLNKILFLDDDIIVQKDLTPLWEVNLNGKVNGAVETCGESFHRFDKYLNFSNPHIARNFNPNACGWAYGMNMFDLKEWKKRDITGIYHKWQNMNENRTLWKLGTLPPGLITFYGLTHPLDKSWHVLGLGYNPSIAKKDIQNAAVVHYNGNMKPWLELAMSKYRPYWTKYIKFDHPYLRRCNLHE
ncbi:hypothetical protein DY000_02056778 [Brassica cretica]|uniref:Hexosyltransferase n=1 Tax=Brassica cretica TaxID=69181 RepID=A0ABQ7A9B9_BRACR|nr:hypothetical protein DY000_02056778 [Brassica cretica]